MTETLVGPTDTETFDAADRRLFATVHGLKAQVVAITEQRDEALERARIAAADAAGLLRVNLRLQAHLDEYNDDRRGYERRIAELEGQNERLRGVATLEMPKYEPTRRGGWRRKR